MSVSKLNKSLNKATNSLNKTINNPMVSNTIIGVLVVYCVFIASNLPLSVAKLFDNAALRMVLMAVIALVCLVDPIKALLMAIGFVLITTKPGQEKMVRDNLEKIEFVTSGWMLFGEYDLIARVQADDEFQLTRCIVEQIRPMDGIADTKTLIGAEL